ncbi:MAG TPA: hypothetical protein VK369_13260, partial [Segetibacter sp.]|nr:hypothetical protein [Segetibacter sp.]
MKTIYLFLIIAIYIDGYGQTTKSSHNKINGARISKNNTNSKRVYNHSGDNSTIGQRETVTERYLKGPSDKNRNADTSTGKRTGNTSPFVGGIHSSPDAGEKFDTANQ